MSVRSRTRLQRATVELAELLDRARGSLGEREYEAFVAVAVLQVEREASRLLLGEALRAIRREPTP